MLPGSDPARAGEAIVYTAHWDGSSPLESAASVATLLGMARSAASRGALPRTQIFAALSPQSEYFLGGRYLFAHLPQPAQKVIAHINLDGINPLSSDETVIQIGRGRSSIDALLDAAAKEQERKVLDDPQPELGLFYRSESLLFARRAFRRCSWASPTSSATCRTTTAAKSASARPGPSSVRRRMASSCCPSVVASPKPRPGRLACPSPRSSTPVDRSTADDPSIFVPYRRRTAQKELATMFSLRSKAAPASPLGGGLIGAGSPRDSYDMLPYLSRCIPQTQPDNLALAAILRGIEPVPVDRASVLELGCASGGNLIPLAATWPGSRFVGIDRSSVQINQGQEFLPSWSCPISICASLT